MHLRYSSLSLPHRGLAGTPQPWRDQLQGAIEERESGTINPDSPEYLVFSDGVLVAVLTAAAHVVLPDYPLSSRQAKHQRAAAEALGDLHRHTLRDLADRRAAREGREHDAAAEYEPHPGGALRVAPLADATDTRWVHIGADLDQARRTMQEACGVDVEQALIVTAAGYGRYGRDRHRIDLDLLCAMHQIADKHGVSLGAVGDWLDAEGATTASDVSPQQIVEQFAAAYIGPFRSEDDYTRHRMRQLGWTQALHAAGIPENYIDLRAITRDWFTQLVRRIDSGSWERVEVFHRGQPT